MASAASGPSSSPAETSRNEPTSCAAANADATSANDRVVSASSLRNVSGRVSANSTLVAASRQGPQASARSSATALFSRSDAGTIESGNVSRASGRAPEERFAFAFAFAFASRSSGTNESDSSAPWTSAAAKSAAAAAHRVARERRGVYVGFAEIGSSDAVVSSSRYRRADETSAATRKRATMPSAHDADARRVSGEEPVSKVCSSEESHEVVSSASASGRKKNVFVVASSSSSQASSGSNTNARISRAARGSPASSPHAAAVAARCAPSTKHRGEASGSRAARSADSVCAWNCVANRDAPS